MSHRRRIGQARRSSENLLARAFLASPQPMSINTLAEGRFINVNDSFLALTGYRREEIIGRTGTALNIYAEPENAAQIRRLLKERGTIRDLEMNFRVRSGAVRVGLLSAEIIEYEGQGCVLAAVTDITSRKQLEDALWQRAEKLAEANRIKDEFLAVLSHELRTPLTLILGWARLLSSGQLDKATSARGLKTIKRNAKLQARLIDDLLDVSRIIAGKIHLDVSPVNLVSVIEAAIDVVRPAAEAKAIQIESVLNPKVGLVSGDPIRLQQVVWNLLSNAVKFTPEEGEVTLTAGADEEQVTISVSDTGVGIAKEDQARIFEKFEQLVNGRTKTAEGTGLGLALSKALVELHGGTISLESELGVGSTFRIRLPRKQASEAAA